MSVNKTILLFIIVFFSVSNLMAKKAPDFTFKDSTGNEISLSDFKGKVVIINFWATWCGPCLYEMPSLEKLYKNYKKDGLQVLGLTVQSQNELVPQKLSETGVSYPVLLNAEDAVKTYGPFNSIPQTFIINRKGEIVKEIMGVRSYAQMETEIKKHL